MSEITLPEGWVEVTLNEIAKWGAGGTPPRKNKKYYDGDIPWIKTGDLGERVLKNTSEYINELAIENSSAKIFPKGSIALAMYGVTIGKTSILGMDCASNQACAVGIPNKATTSDFLYYLIKNEKLKFIAKGKGGAQPNISQTVIKSHKVNLPSSSEQKVIVAKLDSYLTTVSQIQARLDAIPKTIEKFRQSVLRDAMNGTLTEEWRTANNLEFDWQEKKLGSIAKEVKYGLTASSTHINTGIKFVRITDLHKNNINWNSVPYCEATAEEFERYKLDKGDLLFARTGATVGKSYLLRKTPKNAVFASYLIKVSIGEEHNDEYLGLFFQSLNYWHQISTLKSGIGQPSVNGTKLKGLLIPLPKLREQTEIVKRVNQLFAHADQIEKNVAVAKARVDHLTQSILHQAFTGKLTAQWRKQNPDLISGDNSAEALLAKIQADKAKKAKPKRRTKTKKDTSTS